MDNKDRKREIERLVKIFKENMRYDADIGFFVSFELNWSLLKEKFIKGNRIIEIGCGLDTGISEIVIYDGASEYIGIEPVRRFYESSVGKVKNYFKPKEQEKIQIVNQDGLEFLASQPKESAIILSFGVFSGETQWHISPEDMQRYMQLFCEETYRVTPAGQITIHHPFCNSYKPLLEKAGFKPYMDSDIVGTTVWIKE